MLTARIEPLLAKLVDSDQGGGVKNRLIEDQLIMIQDIFDYYKDKKDRAMIEAQDLSSAFDFVSHQYLCEVLVAMNFSEAIINLVKAIYNNLYSAVTVNGAKTRYFKLTRSIRQGDPSAVTWFILAIEPLANLIRASKSLHPVILPNQNPKRLNMFIDDTAIISTDPDDHEVIQQINKTYEQGSGAKFNPTKSEILLMGTWSEAAKAQLPTNNIKENVKLLGVWFGPQASSLNGASIISKIDKAIDFWKNIPFSFAGKKLIIFTKIMSQLTHVARITGMDHKLQQEVQKRITMFFWLPRKMCLIAMATLQNSIDDGGLGLPNLKTFNQAILTERIAKIMSVDKPWKGQLIYRNGYSLRKIDSDYASNQYMHTFKQTHVSDVIVSTYRELKDIVSDWSKENLKSLQRKLYKISELRPTVKRDFSETWTQINKCTTNRKCRDMCYLIAHNALPLNSMLNERHVIANCLCELCGLERETVHHVFLTCCRVQKLRRTLEKRVNAGKSLSEEEILYHEGRTKMKKKVNATIAEYKHVIWITRAKIYYGETNKKDMEREMQIMFQSRMNAK
jgi:hypothetical protein